MNEKDNLSLYLYRNIISFSVLQNLGRLARRLIELLEFTEPEMNFRGSKSEAIRRLLWNKK